MFRLLSLALFAAPAQAQTIVDLAAATPELSTLVTALAAGNLLDTLRGPGPFTVFAPTNEAFDLLPPGTIEFLLDPANIGELVDVLTYHAAAGDVRSPDLSNGQLVATLQGDDVRVSILSGRALINDGEVTAADILATNGVVHIIDRVLLPPAPRPSANIVELAVATPDLSTLVVAVVAGGLVETLSGPGPFTVFAPTNEAFDLLPAGTIEFLLDPANIGALVNILTYHVVAGEAMAGSLCNGQSIETIQGQDVSVTIIGSRVFIDGSEVIAADVLASNGVVHLIDQVLLPAAELTKLNAQAASRQAILL